MSSRRNALARLVAGALVLLAASPVTAPFTTCDLTGVSYGTSVPGTTAADHGLSTIKTCADQLVAVPSGVALTPPFRGGVVRHPLESSDWFGGHRIPLVLRV